MSSPLKNKEIQKVQIRPLLIKNETLYQFTEQRQAQAFHRNLTNEQCVEWLKNNLTHFKQSILFTSQADYQILFNKKQKMTVLTTPPSKALKMQAHNIPKQYLLKEGVPAPFLIDLGVMSSEGKVIAKKSDKFRQINRFLEMIEDILPHLTKTKKKIRIVDFGCGKAYLTFALYHYLKFIKCLEIELIGLDLKPDVIQSCRQLSVRLGFEENLRFQLGDINSFQTDEAVDMVISLHACDTATDAALEKAIRWESEVILCVPCCQHELYNQIECSALNPLLKHGILKERFAALATDALRAQLLEVLGYQTQVLEFIDLEHTPKNLLIRAVKNKKARDRENKWHAYLQMKETLHAKPSLEIRFNKELY
jgi:SAM-dependent methyltransferase